MFIRTASKAWQIWKPKLRSKFVTESPIRTPILRNMNYQDGKMLRMSNSLDQCSSQKIKIQLHGKTEVDFGKMDVRNTSGRLRPKVRKHDPRRSYKMRKSKWSHVWCMITCPGCVITHSKERSWAPHLWSRAPDAWSHASGHVIMEFYTPKLYK